MPSKYETGEIVDLAKAIYKEKIKHLVEPTENGKYVVIDVESGDYEIDEQIIAASGRLRERRPNAVVCKGIFGYRAADSLGGGIREKTDYNEVHIPFKGYKPGEVTELAKAIYKEKIKSLVEPSENGKFIVIDVENGDYEIAEKHITASDRLRERRPNAVAYAGRVGYRTAYSTGGGLRPTDD